MVLAVKKKFKNKFKKIFNYYYYFFKLNKFKIFSHQSLFEKSAVSIRIPNSDTGFLLILYSRNTHGNFDDLNRKTQSITDIKFFFLLNYLFQNLKIFNSDLKHVFLCPPPPPPPPPRHDCIYRLSIVKMKAFFILVFISLLV